MKRDLYINGRHIDLSNADPVAITLQVNDIAELSDRQANYSNTFNIPDTNNNRVALGFANSVSSGTNIPYRKSPCVYIQDGVWIVKNGVAIASSYAGYFEVTIYSGIFDIFQQWGEKGLKDIDWSEYDHTYDSPTIRELNKQYLKDNSDIVWPLVQWGAYVKIGPIDLRYQNPGIKYSAVIDKIIGYTTYTKAGQIFGDGIYQDMVLLLNPEKYGQDEDSLLAKTYRATVGGFAPTPGAGAGDGQVFTDTGIVTYGGGRGPGDGAGTGGRRPNVSNLLAIFNDKTLGKDSDNILRESVNPNVIPYPIPIAGTTPPVLNTTRYLANGYYTLRISTKINFKSITIGPEQVYRIFKNSVLVNAVAMFTFPVTEPATTYQNVPFENIYNLDVAPGDVITISMLASNFTVYASDGYGTNYLKMEAIDSSPLYGNVSYKSIIPDFKFKDFIRSFCQKFGLLISSEENVVTFTKFSEIKQNIGISEDWSDKIDISTIPAVSYRIGDYSQLNNAKYDFDEDTNGFGDGTFSINDQTLQAEGDMIELIYPSSLPEPNIYFTNKQNEGVNIPKYTLVNADIWSFYKEYSAGDTVNYGGVIYYAKVDNISIVPASDFVTWGSIDFQYEATKSSSARVVLVRKLHSVAGVFATDYFDGVTYSNADLFNVPLAYFSDSTQPFNLTFNFLLQTYYRDLQNMLSNLKVVNCLIRLTDADISKIDFLTLKYIKYFDNYFYLNKIEDYIGGGQSSNVQLIRM